MPFAIAMPSDYRHFDAPLLSRGVGLRVGNFGTTVLSLT